MKELSYPPHWRVVPLGEVVRTRVGVATSQKRPLTGTEVPYLRPANITVDGLDLDDLQSIDLPPADREALRLAVGDLLLAESSGSPELVGRSAVWSGEVDNCVFANTIVRLRTAALLPEFLRVVLEHHRLSGLLVQSAKGVGIQHLPLSRLRSVHIPIPSEREQRDVVSALQERRDDLKSARTKVIQAHAASVEQEALVLQGALVADGQLEARLADLGSLRRGETRDSSRPFSDPEVRFVGVAQVQEGRLVLDDLPVMRVPQAKIEEASLQRGDVLLTAGGSAERLGRPALVSESLATTTVFQNHIMRYRCGPQLLPAYALVLLRHLFRAGAFATAARGSTNLAHLSLKDVGAIVIRVPDIGAQEAIASQVMSRLEAVAAERELLEQSLANIADAETALYALAVSGRLAAADVDELAIEALVDGEQAAKDAAIGTPRPRRRPTDRPAQRLPTDLTANVLEHLRAVPDGVSIPDLIVRLGLNRNRVADVERLFAALRLAGEEHELAFNGAENSKIQLVLNASG